MVGFGKKTHSCAYLQGERFFSSNLFFQTLGKFNHQPFKKGLIQTNAFRKSLTPKKCGASFAERKLD